MTAACRGGTHADVCRPVPPLRHWSTRSFAFAAGVGMRLPVRKLLMALAFGFGAIALPATLIVIEAAKTPRPELHDAAYARTLLSQGRLAWQYDQQATVGGSTVRGVELNEPGSGY
jgi:hypothetical protein